MRSVATRFLLPVGLITVLFSTFVIYRTYTISQRHLAEVIDQQAALALEFDLAIRKYVAEEIRPRAEEMLPGSEFIPETMSTSFVARSVFETVKKQFPDYIIKFSSDDPRNPANRASADELRMIDYFNSNPLVDKWSGRISMNGRPYYARFAARRMRESCLRCHGGAGRRARVVARALRCCCRLQQACGASCCARYGCHSCRRSCGGAD